MALKLKGLICGWLFSWLVILSLTICSPATAEPLPSYSFETKCTNLPEVTIVRPEPEDIATPVSVGIYIFDLAKINDVQQSFSVDFLLQLQWKDKQLGEQVQSQFDPYCQLPLDRIWHPQVQIFNPRELTTELKDLAYISSEGTVTYLQRYYGEMLDSFDFQRFPFDTQLLTIKLLSYGYSPEQVRFTEDTSLTGRNEQLSISNWLISEPRVYGSSELIKPLNMSLAAFVYELQAKRLPGFPLWKLLFPATLIVLTAYTVFWLSPLMLIPQVTISVGSILSLVALQLDIGTQLPRIPYLTRSDRFLVGLMLLVFLALIETIATYNLAAAEAKSLAESIDLWWRVIFLLLFAGLVVFCFLS